MPVFTPNHAFSAALYANGHFAWAARVRWAACHYAVDVHVHPLRAASDAAAHLAALVRCGHI
jgi:hypothetical protein